MSRILPRHQRHTERQQDKAKLERILAEPAPNVTTVTKATLAGDGRRLRGIPCVARGVGGASPGTNPLVELIRRDAVRRPC